MPSPRQHFLLAMLAEFRRAAAAAQRYTDLRYRSAARRESTVPGDIPRQVFEEFYSPDEAAESRGSRASVARMANLHLRDEIALVRQRFSEAEAAFGRKGSASAAASSEAMVPIRRWLRARPKT